MLPILIGAAVVIVLLVLFFLSTYTVVEPNKAHIVVIMGGGRKVYTPHQDETKKHATSYFFIPFLMKRIILPLSNVKMEIPAFQLKDKEVAPFTCEVTCWFRIENPDIAVEKLDIAGEGGFESAVRETLEEQVRGIARAAAMKQEILDIMRDRKTFGGAVETEVNGSLEEWGLELVKLEIVDFYDVDGSEIIKDYEDMRKATIEASSRQRVAIQRKEAEIVEAENERLAGIARAEADREVEKAVVDKEKQVRIAQANANAEISKQQELANKQDVSAIRTLEIGKAQVAKDAEIERAKGKAQAAFEVGQADANIQKAKGTAEADVVRSKGWAEASVIKETGLAEAEATDKKAEALKKFNDAGIQLETIKATVQIEMSKYENLGMALSNANVNLVGDTNGAANLFGMNFDAKTGANLGQMLESFEKVTGKSLGDTLSKVKENLKNGQKN